MRNGRAFICVPTVTIYNREVGNRAVSRGVIASVGVDTEPDLLTGGLDLQTDCSYVLVGRES